MSEPRSNRLGLLLNILSITMRHGFVIALTAVVCALQMSKVHASSIVVGKKYVVPAPDDLNNMADYTNLTSQCAANKSSPNCVYALNQFISDMQLMIPDTSQQIRSLSDKIVTDQGITSQKQTQITALQAAVNTLSAQLIAAATSLDAMDDTYYNQLADINANVAALLDPQTSQVYVMANAQRQSMLDTLQALSDAANAYLVAQRSAVTNTANYVFQLYKNDQAIIQADAGNQLGIATDLARNISNQIDSLRQYYQGNLTTESTNLDAQRAKIVAAKADADSKLQAAKDAMASTVLAGIDSAMTTTRTAYNKQLTNVTAIIDAIRTNSYASFDAALATVQGLENNVTAVIDANLTTAQASLDALKSLVDVRLQAAGAARDDASKTLLANQQSAMALTSQNGATLNASISQYLTKTSGVTSRIFGASQAFMTNFANLASDAAAATSGTMKSGATADGNSMSDLNGYIGDMSGQAFAQSTGAAGAMAGSIDSARSSMAMTNIKQIVALANSINTITTLVNLLKAKMGLSSDRVDGQISSIQGLLDYSLNALQATLTQITTQTSNSALQLATDANARLAQIDQIANDGRRASAAQLSDVSRDFNAQLAAVAAKRAEASAMGQGVVADAGALAKKIADANNDLSTKVAALQLAVSQKWDTVSASNTAFASAVTAGLAQLAANAAQLVQAQQQQALTYIQNQQNSFTQTVSSTQTTALTAQSSSINGLANVTTSLLANLRGAQANASKTVTDTTALANSALDTLRLAQPAVAAMEANATTSAQQAAFTAVARMKARVDAARATLLDSARTQTQTFLTNNLPQLDSLNASITALDAQVTAQVAVRDSIFPDGGDPFDLSPDAFQAKVANATSSVTNATQSLASRYASLNSGLSEVYQRLVASDNAVYQRVYAMGTKMDEQLNVATAAAQESVTADAANFTAFAASVIDSDSTASAAQREAALNASGVRTAQFDAMIESAKATANATMSEITDLSAAESQKQAMVADAMDSIIQSLIAADGGNAGLLLKLRNQFARMQSSTFGLGDKLNSSLTNAIASISSASAAAESALQAKIQASNRKSLQGVESLGNRLAYAMDTLDQGSAADKASLQNADSDAVALAQSVAGLGDQAKAQIRDILNKVLSGQMTMDDVLTAKSNMNIAQMQTVEDVIAAFSDAMNSHLVSVQKIYQDEIDRVTTFRDAVPGVLATYESSRQTALRAAQALVDETNATAIAYAQTATSVIADTGAAVDDARAKVGAMTNAIPDQLTQIRNAIKNAVLQVEASQDSVTEGIRAAALTIRSLVANKLRVFKVAKNKPNYALLVESVAAPTLAPMIAISI